MSCRPATACRQKPAPGCASPLPREDRRQHARETGHDIPGCRMAPPGGTAGNRLMFQVCVQRQAIQVGVIQPVIVTHFCSRCEGASRSGRRATGRRKACNDPAEPAATGRPNRPTVKGRWGHTRIWRVSWIHLPPRPSGHTGRKRQGRRIPDGFRTLPTDSCASRAGLAPALARTSPAPTRHQPRAYPDIPHTAHLPWTCPGPALDLPWTCPGPALDLPWTCPTPAPTPAPHLPRHPTHRAPALHRLRALGVLPDIYKCRSTLP